MKKLELTTQIQWGPNLLAFLEFLIGEGLDEFTAKSFIEYHLSKKELWKAYEHVALLAIKSGVKKQWGSKELMVFALLRLTIKLKENNPDAAEYPHTNSMTAYYSRLFKYRYPDLGKFLREDKIRGLTKRRLEGSKAA